MRLAHPIGVVDIAYGGIDDVPDRSRLARTDGFAHIDVLTTVDAATLALPIGCPTAFPRPQARWCSTPALPRDDDGANWDRCVRWWRAAPGALLEPWGGAVVHDRATIEAFAEAVPGVRFLIDTGHIAAADVDPVELLEFADHLQLRQAAPGRTQVHADDPDGCVDFPALLARLERLDYRGRCSIEYFDLPDQGWTLDDPRGWACDLLARLHAVGA
jgi:sugar phosphate isomerase/epimerase